jgi:hypothetical protein
MSDFFAAAREAKAARRAAILRAVAGMPAEPESGADADKPVVPSFDGGAQRDQPEPAPSHAETLASILALRSADAGRDL